jgi:diacylglycerol kinase family enzyme
MLMAGIGWDAEIARQVSLPLKKRIGDLAYVAQTLRMLPRLRPHTARWSFDSDELEAPLAWMVLGNTRLYGGRIRLTPAATITDGLLDMIALCPPRAWDAARIAARLAVGRVHGDRHVVEGQVPEVRVQTPGLAVQLDGDYAGETPMTFSVDPGALRVSVPAGPLAPIFG